MNRFGENGQNERFWAKMAIFCHFLGRNGENDIFWGKAKMSLPYAYYAATLCKKTEQTYERILRSRTDKRTNESEFLGPSSAPRGTKRERVHKDMGT